MKSRYDFQSESMYNEYLRHYYAAFAMQAVCVHYMILDKKDMDKNLDIALELSDILIEKLKKK